MPEPIATEVFRDAAALAAGAAEFFAGRACRAAREGRRFRAALPGGTSPLGMFAALAAEPLRSRVPWRNVRLYWVDERCVPWRDPRSNYGAARAALLSKVPLARSSVFPVDTALPPARAAAAYDRLLRGVPAGGGCQDAPLFDLIVLGVGADGHCASLFPGGGALLETKRLAVAVSAPPGVEPRRRVTLTPAALNNGAELLYLAFGPAKHAAARALYAGSSAGKNYPALQLSPRGRRFLYCDRAAYGE